MRQALIRLSFIEGASLLALLGIAMPMKYIFGDPSLVKVIGMIHGVLFLALVGLIAVVARKERWSPGLVIFALVTSSIPFGMFLLEKKLRSQP